MSEASSTEDVITLRIRFRSETFEKFTERYAADLTQNEIFIRTREPLPVGSSLALDFSLNDGSPLISGRGSVAWTRGPELTQQAPSGMGIRFESLTGPSRQMLANILEAKARLANNQPITPPAPAAPPERPEPPRMPRPAAAAAALTTRPPPEKNAGRSDAGRAVPASSSSGRYPAVTLPPSPPPPTAALAPPAPTVPLAPVPPAAPTRPTRSAFLEDDAEPTELANLPPAFFYESADEEDPEKTRLQDPRASAALLRQQMADTEDDLTNPRARASTYSGGGLGTGTRPLAKSMLKAPAKAPPRAPASREPDPEPELEPDPSPPPASAPIVPTLSSDWATRMPRTGRPERRTPPESPVSYGGQSPAATREIKAPVLPNLSDSQTDNNPLILSSSTTEALPPDPWRPSPASMATAPIQMPPERDPFYGQPSVSPPPPPPPRWGSGNMETMETMNTSPSLPAVLGQDPHANPHTMSAPAWPVPTDNPDVQLPPAQPSDDEARKSRNASVRMWVAMTLAAAGIVAAALLLLPALLKPSPQVGEATPPPPAAPAEAPATEDKAAAGNPTATPPASPPPAGEGAASPPSAAASPPTPPAAAGTAAARTVEAATAKPDNAAPQDPPPGAEGAQAARQPGGLAGRPVRPGGPLPGRNPRRTAREVIAAADARERAAAAAAAPVQAIAPPPAVTEVVEPKAPVAAPPGVQSDGAEEVYWLTVRSIPSGADVLIDGQVEGQTPFVRRIFDPSRSYALTVRRSGFDPHERTLSTSDVWTKRGNVRTLTVVAKLSPAAGLPNQAEPLPVSPTRGAEPTQPATSDPPATAPPPIEPDRKTNPFADPAAPGGAQPQ